MIFAKCLNIIFHVSLVEIFKWIFSVGEIYGCGSEKLRSLKEFLKVLE